MNTDILKRVPPQNLEAEQSVLGAILIENKALEHALEIVVPDDFYREAHREILKAMLVLAEHQTGIDAVTLTDVLRNRGMLEQVGGPAYIAELAAMVPTWREVVRYSRIVREKGVLRSLGSMATDIAAQTYDAPPNWSPEWTEELVAVAEYDLAQIANRVRRKPQKPRAELIDSMFWRLKNGQSLGVSTGFDSLDAKIGGFTPADLHVIGARANVGKTRFAAAIALNLIARQDPVLYVSLEMPEEPMWQRFAGTKAQVDTFEIARRGFDPFEETNFQKAMTDLKIAPLEILYRPGIKPRELRIDAKKAARELGSLKLIVVDYVGLMHPDKVTRERFADRGEIVQSLKELAGDMKCPVIAVSQLNREVEEKKPPTLGQLRDTGCTEEHASTVLLLWEPPAKKDEIRLDTEGGKEIEIIIAKARGGPKGRCRMFFRESIGRFLDT